MNEERAPRPIPDFESMVLGELTTIERIVQRWVPPDFVDDIVQETMLHAYIGVETLRDARAFPSWIRTVAYNRCQQWHRNRYAHQNATMRLWDGTREGNPLDTVDASTDLTEAMRWLSSVEREAVQLRYLQGWTSTEIAARQGAPASTVRWRIKLSLSKLRNLLKEANDDE